MLDQRPLDGMQRYCAFDRTVLIMSEGFASTGTIYLAYANSNSPYPYRAAPIVQTARLEQQSNMFRARTPGVMQFKQENAGN